MPMLNKFELVSLAFAALTACSSTPGMGSDDAYWQDQRWDGKLLDAVQSALHYPLDANGQPVQPIPQEAQATVGFTYVDGKIKDPRIIASSGRADLDAAFLTQVVAADPPSAHGSHAAEPHPFELVLEMPTPMQVFDIALYTAVTAKREYPQEAVNHGAQGVVTVGFKYHEGKASEIKTENSSGSPVLDRAAMRSVQQAHMPPQPPWMQQEPLNMTISLCYSLGNSNICPPMQAVLQVSDPSKDDQPASPPSGP